MEKVNKRKICTIPGVRYVFAVNGMMGFLITYGLRVNLNVAIVAMVNNTAVYNHVNDTHSNECPDPNFNSTDSDIKKDGPFLWSPATQGHILAAFYYGYWASQVPGGVLADRYSGKWVFGAGALATALFTLLTPVAADHGVPALIGVRVIQGIAQGITLPAMCTLLGRWLPDTEKGVLNTIVHSGINVGTMVSMPVTGYLCQSHLFGGWPSSFYVLGACGAAWLLVWCALVTDGPQTHPFISEKELRYIESNQRFNHKTKIPPIPWSKILKSVPFWTYVVVQTCQDWSFFTMMTDLPTFFATILHFPLTENGFFSAFPHFLQTVVGVSVTVGTDYILRRGWTSTNRVRKVCNSISGFGSALALLGVCLAGCDVISNKAYFIIAIAIAGFAYSGHMLTLLDMCPEYVGTLMGIASTISNLTGFLTPLVVGALTDKEQTLVQWRIVFGISASLLCFASVGFIAFGTADKQDWADPQPNVGMLQNPENEKANRKDYTPLNS